MTFMFRLFMWWATKVGWVPTRQDWAVVVRCLYLPYLGEHYINNAPVQISFDGPTPRAKVGYSEDWVRNMKHPDERLPVCFDQAFQEDMKSRGEL